jgi:hypothetical protein
MIGQELENSLLVKGRCGGREMKTQRSEEIEKFKRVEYGMYLTGKETVRQNEA